MKTLKIFSFVSLLTLGSLIVGCKKETTTSKTDLTSVMLSDKIWYLNYKQQGSVTNTYLGNNTYYIKFLSNKTTEDSDGLVGTYTINELGSQMQINVNAKTTNSNTITYSHTIESIGEKKLVLSYTPTGQTSKITLYYSSN
jgi:hypothetical protein